MQAEQSILDKIQRRQLKWYGHLLEYRNYKKFQTPPLGAKFKQNKQLYRIKRRQLK